MNLEGCMFDLKTMLEYFDALFIDFEKERLSKKVFEEINSDFKKKIEKTNQLVSDVYEQLDDIKNMYDLDETDIEIIHEVNKVLVIINDDYKKLIAKVDSGSTPYSILQQEVEDLTLRLASMEDEFDKAYASAISLYV